MSDEAVREFAERQVHWRLNSPFLQYATGTAAGKAALRIDDRLVQVIGANGRMVNRERRFPHLWRLWRWLLS